MGNKSQKQRYNTHMVQPWLRHAPKNQIVEPRKYNSKLSFVGVRCSSCKQIQKKKNSDPLKFIIIRKSHCGPSHRPSNTTIITHLLINFFGFPPNFIQDLQLKKKIWRKKSTQHSCLSFTTWHTRLLSRYNIDIYIRWTDCKSCDGSVTQSQTPSTYLYAAPKRPPKTCQKEPEKEEGDALAPRPTHPRWVWGVSIIPPYPQANPHPPYKVMSETVRDCGSAPPMSSPIALPSLIRLPPPLTHMCVVKEGCGLMSIYYVCCPKLPVYNDTTTKKRASSERFTQSLFINEKVMNNQLLF